MSALRARFSKKNGTEHPFATQEPKPTRARLVGLLDPLGRRRYAEVERFLATVQGATSGLHYYDARWGWAVRYMLGSKEELCTLHLLPDIFESTVSIHNEVDTRNNGFSPEFRRRISRTKTVKSARPVRMPLKNDHDYSNFQMLIKVKADFLRSGGSKAAKGKAAKSKEAAKETKDAAKKATGAKKTAKKVAKKEAVKGARKTARSRK